MTNDIIDGAVIFPPEIMHAALEQIPSNYNNGTLEVVFWGKGSLIWQQKEKLSCAYLGNRIITKSVVSTESAFLNSTPQIVLDKSTVAVQSSKVIANNMLLVPDYHRNYAPTANGEVYLGYMRPQTPNPLNGRIYAIRYYTRLLTDEEIQYNQRIDNVRFGLGLNLAGPLIPYIPNRSLTLIEEEDER